MRENEVAAAITHAEICGSETFGGDCTSMVPVISTGKYAASPHLNWIDKKYKPEDALTIEIAGCYRRYHVPMTRTVSIGPVPDYVREAGKVIANGIQETLAVTKPGITAEEAAVTN